MNKCYTYTVTEEDQLLNYQINMIKHNNIQNLLRFKQLTDEEMKLYYYNDGLISLESFIRINGINLSFLKDLLIQVKEIMSSNEKYFLSQENYMMTIQSIYISLENLKIKLIYLPIKRIDDFNTNLNLLMKTIVYEHLETFNLEQSQRKKMLKICKHEMSIDKIISILNNFELAEETTKVNNNGEGQTEKKHLIVSKNYLLLVGYFCSVMGAFYFQLLSVDIMTVVIIMMIGLLSGFLIYQKNDRENLSEQQKIKNQKTMMLDQQQSHETYTLINLNNGEIISLNEDYNVIGRGEEATIQLTDQYIGRRHCALMAKGEDFYIKDLNSKNGVVVNHRTIKPGQLVKVSPKDTIKVGKTPVKISKSSN